MILKKMVHRKIIDRILEWILIWLMAIITLDVLWGVFTRYALGAQASWSEELARYLLIWIGILGAAYASGKKLHLAIDILPSKLEGKAKTRLTLIIAVLVILFVIAVMVIGGIRLVFISYKLGQTSAALQIPLYVVYLVVPLSGIFIIYYRLQELIHPPESSKV
jgi:TRAP-type C4-dicarboxylate transport system permease small subunit